MALLLQFACLAKARQDSAQAGGNRKSIRRARSPRHEACARRHYSTLDSVAPSICVSPDGCTPRDLAQKYLPTDNDALISLGSIGQTFDLPPPPRKMALTICSTRLKTEIKEVRWNIKDFPLSNLRAGEKIVSPEGFQTDDKIEWKLAIFPKGQCGDGEEFVSLYLFAVKESLNRPVQSTFTLRLENSRGKELETRRYNWRFPSESGHYSYGTSNFASRADLLSRISKDGTLVVYCQLCVSRGESVSVDRVAPITRHPSSLSQQLCKRKQHIRFTGKILWRIFDFESYDHLPGEKLVSIKFSPCGQVMWKLFIFPRGISEEVKEFVSVYLVADRNTIDRQNAQETFYKISFRDSQDHEIASRTYHWRCPADNDHTGFGTEDFITRERLLGALSARTDRQLKVVCDLTTKPLSAALATSLSILSDIDKRDMIRNGTLIYLSDSNSVAVPICKELLCLHSPVFQAMFNHDTKENQNRVIELPFCSHKVLRGLAEFLEKGRSRFVHQVPEDLLLLADCYDIAALKRVCETQLMRDANCSNMYRLAALADRTNSKVLCDYATNLIASHVGGRHRSRKWKKFSDDNPDLAKRILDKKASNSLSVYLPDWLLSMTVS